MQKLRTHLHLAGVDLVQLALAILAADDVAMVEAIDQHFLTVFVVTLQQKVSWQANSE